MNEVKSAVQSNYMLKKKDEKIIVRRNKRRIKLLGVDHEPQTDQSSFERNERTKYNIEQPTNIA